MNKLNNLIEFMDLIDLQKEFYNFILDDINRNNEFDKEKVNIHGFIKSDFKQARLEIYKTNVIENFITVLKNIYSDTWKLLSNNFARVLAVRYLKNSQAKQSKKKLLTSGEKIGVSTERNHSNLPSSGCLDDWGYDFYKFLALQSELKDFKFIIDYSEFESYYNKVKYLPESQAIDPRDLINLNEDILKNINLELRTELYLYKSDYDIEKIYNNLSLNNKKINNKLFNNLDNKKTYLVIIKHSDKVYLLWLSPEIWYFLCYLNNNSFGSAVDLVQARYQDFNLVDSLSFILTNGLIKSL